MSSMASGPYRYSAYIAGSGYSALEYIGALRRLCMFHCRVRDSGGMILALFRRSVGMLTALLPRTAYRADGQRSLCVETVI